MIGLALALSVQAAPVPVESAAARAKRESAACKAAAQAQDEWARANACMAMKPPRVFTGIYLDEFEGQQFYENASAIPVARDATVAWIDGAWRLPPGVVVTGAVATDPPRAATPRLYRVRFVGAEPVDTPCRTGFPFCYGHMGVSPRLVVVREMLAIEDLGPPPR